MLSWNGSHSMAWTPLWRQRSCRDQRLRHASLLGPLGAIWNIKLLLSWTAIVPQKSTMESLIGSKPRSALLKTLCSCSA